MTLALPIRWGIALLGFACCSLAAWCQDYLAYIPKGLAVVNVETGERIDLVEVTPRVEAGHVSWLPTSGKLAYMTVGIPGYEAHDSTLNIIGQDGVKAFNDDGIEDYTVYNDRVVYQKRIAPGSIYIVSADGAHKSKIEFDDVPSYSPDGKLMLTYTPGGPMGLLGKLSCSTADGNNLVLLADKIGPIDGEFTWSPANKRIIVMVPSAEEDGTLQTRVCRTDAAEKPIVITTPAGFNAAFLSPLTWSPDSSRLVFLYQNYENMEEPPSLFVYNLQAPAKPAIIKLANIVAGVGDSEEVASMMRGMILAGLPGSLKDSQWSPDGAKFAFTLQSTMTSPGAQLFVVDCAGSCKRIASAEISLNHLYWTPDSKQVIVECNDTERQTNAKINAFTIDGAGQTNLASGMAPALSLDGTRLAYWAIANDTPSVFIVDLENPANQKLIGTAPKKDRTWFEPPVWCKWGEGAN